MEPCRKEGPWPFEEGGNRTARLTYGVEYNAFDEDEIGQPFRIHYTFQVYENGQLSEHPIEGLFENMNPIFSPEEQKTTFKFVPYIKGDELQNESADDYFNWDIVVTNDVWIYPFSPIINKVYLWSQDIS